MTKQYYNLIDAVNRIPRARQSMAFSIRRDQFKIVTHRNSQNVPTFLIAMYSGQGTFCGYY